MDTIKLADSEPPLWLTSSPGSIWVGESHRVLRLSSRTDAVLGAVPTHEVSFTEPAVGFGSVWESNFGLNVVYRIDIAAMKVVATIPVGDSPEGVAVTTNAVWVANHHGGTVSRIDPTTNQVTATVKVGPSGENGPLSMAATADAVWVFVPSLSGVVGINAATNELIATLPLNGPPASDGKAVWVAAFNGMTQTNAVQIDPLSGKVLASVPVDGNPPSFHGIAVAYGAVWLTTSAGLFRVDPKTDTAVGHVACDCASWTTAGDGFVWLSADAQTYVLKVKPQ